ncbi:MAG: serine hydrolase domain-containing protein, partial [Gammaproteobacteria bacterium]
KLQAAIAFAIAHENPAPRDLELTQALERAHEPYDAVIGPMRPRGGPTGLILRGGRIVAQWGEPDRVDMTFSLTKSFLSATVGIALDRKLIRNVDDRVAATLPGYFESEHNRTITWNHLLRQTSNWRGTLWDKPDWADRPVGDEAFKWPAMPVPVPGAGWKYNDVRVNLLALAALHVWREPLPAVLKRELMDPIGASDTWRWHGYENSWVEIDDKRVQSVSGGGHWGGGMFIHAWDQARFGLLCLRGGAWGGRRIWSEEWHRFASTPTPHNSEYGVMNWFLNTGRKQMPSAPASAVAHLGNGVNAVYVDPENDVVVVARWLQSDQLDAFIGHVLGAMTAATGGRR